MLREHEAVVRKAMIGFDAILVAFVFFLSFFLRSHFHFFYHADLMPAAHVVADMPATIKDYLFVLMLVVPLWCFVLHMNGMYVSLRTKSLLEFLWIIIKSAFITTIAFGTLVFLLKIDFVSRVFFIMFMAMSSLAILLEKMVMFFAMRYLRKKGYNYRKLLIVGTGRRALHFIQKVVSHPEWGMRIAGAIDYDRANLGEKVGGVEILGMLEDIPKIAHTRAIDEVIFIVPRALLNHIENYLYACETQGIRTTIAVDLFDLKISKLRQTEIEGVPLITFESTPMIEWELFAKRFMDAIASGIGILVLSPLLLLTAIAIKVTSKGPVLFIQKRVGLNGKKFILYKFRSMYKGAHMKLSELMGKNEMSGPVFKIKNDPRITPLGKILRKLSVDELPQLFNVFMGQMSLVGPRPPLPKEVNQYEPWQRRRLSMRPGITCLWQISGRNKIGFDEWMKLDLQYIDNWSLWLDFKILLKTIPVVLFGIGAS